jgi:hypothetical protein
LEGLGELMAESRIVQLSGAREWSWPIGFFRDAEQFHAAARREAEWLIANPNALWSPAPFVNYGHAIELALKGVVIGKSRNQLGDPGLAKEIETRLRGIGHDLNRAASEAEWQPGDEDTNLLAELNRAYKGRKLHYFNLSSRWSLVTTPRKTAVKLRLVDALSMRALDFAKKPCMDASAL